ncbi:hypothetical protein Hanom_Chr07g00580341 [Helianthus anomalus]
MDRSSQKLIPDKHRFIITPACFLSRQILLKTLHDMIGVAKKEVLCKIHRTQKLLVSSQTEN